MSQIRVHVSKQGEPAVPNTGAITAPQQTYDANGDNDTSFYFGLGVIIAIFLVVFLPAFFYKKWKKQGFSKKQLVPRVLLLAIFSFSLSFAALNFVKNSTENTIGVTANDNLTVTAADVDIYVELGDEPVYAVMPTTIKVAESTDGGYILSAYATSLDLLSGTGNKISGITPVNPTSLEGNNWGISIVEPESQTSTTWQVVPENEENALKIKETTATTPENDSTTIYYGVYISPDLPIGTYIGTVNYNVKTNLVLQNVSEWRDSIAQGQEISAVDKRDGKSYLVARLADGSIWMTQNLALNLDSSKTYTPSDTDIEADWTPIQSTQATDDTTWNASNTTPVSYNPGNKYWNELTNTQGGSADMDNYISESGTPHYSLGNYYNWTAAIAMNDSSSVELGTNVDQSICPSGWRLPKSTGINSATSLFNEYDYDSSTRTIPSNPWESPMYFSLTGEWNGRHAYIGNYGLWWYSSLSSSIETRASRLYTNLDKSVLLGYATTRSTGISVRCVARPVISDLTYMQDFSKLVPGDKKSVLASMEEDKQYQLEDIRDEKIYWISKLKDGNVWMTQNLDLNLSNSVALTHSDSDLGWGDDKETTSWTPTRSTINATSIINNTITGWSNNANSPFSVDPGDYYWIDTWYASVANNFLAGNMGEDPVKWRKGEPFDGNGEHGHVGNYYNWTAAVAMNSSSAYSTSTVSDISASPQNSICPAGWRLPHYGYKSGVGVSELTSLVLKYFDSEENFGVTLISAPLYFVRSGRIFTRQARAGEDAVYWTSSVSDGTYSYGAYISGTALGINGSNRKNGVSIRCLVR